MVCTTGRAPGQTENQRNNLAPDGTVEYRWTVRCSERTRNKGQTITTLQSTGPEAPDGTVFRTEHPKGQEQATATRAPDGPVQRHWTVRCSQKTEPETWKTLPRITKTTQIKTKSHQTWGMSRQTP